MAKIEIKGSLDTSHLSSLFKAWRHVNSLNPDFYKLLSLIPQKSYLWWTEPKALHFNWNELHWTLWKLTAHLYNICSYNVSPFRYWELWLLTFGQKVQRLSRKHPDDHHGGSKHTETSAQWNVHMLFIFILFFWWTHTDIHRHFISDNKHLRIW